MIFCSLPDCRADATVAVKTTRPSRADIRSTVYYTPEMAPRTASRYCAPHAQKLLADLVDLLGEPEPDPAPPTEKGSTA